MTLASLTDPSAVHAAVAEFEELGEKAFLEKYGFGSNVDYHVIVDEKRYPSKAIIGAAHAYQHGEPLKSGEFHGGYRTVGRRLQALGFEVQGSGRSPDWTPDELILALDLYMREGERGAFSATARPVVELSQVLRLLTVYDEGVRSSPTFRNPSGVALKLHNFAAIDPDHAGAGMAHGARGDQATWDAWAHRPDELHVAAGLIRAVGTAERVDDETGEPEEYSAPEGRILYRMHRRRERDRNLVRRKKQAVLKQHGELSCEVCGLSGTETYGPDLADVFDVHHVVPLHKVGEGTTRLSDLAVVCPTCHRALHKHRPFVSPDELRAEMNSL